MWIMHGFAMKFCTVFGARFAARGHRSAIALAKIEMMIDVSVEIF
jgi:hypothetical protein